MPINLNDAGEQREFGAVIPDGTFVWVVGNIRKGDYTLPGMDAEDNGLFTKSRTSDVVYLDFEFTVQLGPFAKQKFWQNFTITGGQSDADGKSKGGDITKRALKAMVDSAQGIRSDDMSAEAQAKRTLASFCRMNGIPFACRLEVEPGGPDNRGGDYPDKNRIAIVVTPSDAEYAAIKAGNSPPPQPKQGSARRGAATATQAVPAAAAATGWEAAPPAPAPAAAAAVAPAAAAAAEPAPAPATGWGSTEPTPPANAAAGKAAEADLPGWVS